MPCDVTMERPHTWVVLIPLQHNVCWVCNSTSIRYLLNIPSLRIAWIPDGAVPNPPARGQDLEVVAVYMHWVGCQELIIHDQTDGTGIALIVDVPHSFKLFVALSDSEQDWCVVVAFEGNTVHFPFGHT